MTKYPDWICTACAEKHGGKLPKHASTWHIGECDVCKKETAVTQPRDFGYPKVTVSDEPNDTK